MGGQKLKLPSVKGCRKKRKERSSRKEANSSATSPRVPREEIEAIDSLAETGEANLLLSLPLVSYTCDQANSLSDLHNCLVKNGGFTGWQVVEAITSCLTLAKMKFVPSPHVIWSVQIHSSFEYSVTMEDYSIHLPQLRTVVCSHVCSRVCCVSDVLLLLRTIDTLHLCEGNLCSEFSEVVLYNKGMFYGSPRASFKGGRGGALAPLGKSSPPLNF